jgi:peroxiredoxin family protein
VLFPFAWYAKQKIYVKWGNEPDFPKVAASLMLRVVQKNAAASVDEMRPIVLETGVKMIVCQITVEGSGWSREDFIRVLCRTF